MIAISSFRPLADCDEIAENQIKAKESWESVFTEIVYFGHPEPLLTSAKTVFIEWEPFPKISSLATAASLCDDYAVLINADIVCRPHLTEAINEVIGRGGRCAISQRVNFGVGAEPDFGIDFFFAEPEIWRGVAKSVPSFYRIGHNSFDTWIMSYFNHLYPNRCWDISGRRALWHPVHANRKRQYSFRPTDDEHTLHCGFPKLRLV